MNTRLYCSLGFGVMCGTLGLGCEETVEGKFLDTEGIALVADVTATSENESKVELTFKAGGDESNTTVDLDDDKVTVTADGKTKLLNAKSEGEYSATFDTGESGTKFSIALNREALDKTDAKKTSGTLPETFEVTVDASGDVSRQDELVINWEPYGDADEVRVDLDGTCISFTFEDDLPDNGQFTVPKNDLIFGNDPEDDDEGTCEVEVTVTRTRKGSVDSVFDSESKLRLHQVRSTSFTSVK